MLIARYFFTKKQQVLKDGFERSIVKSGLREKKELGMLQELNKIQGRSSACNREVQNAAFPS